MSAPSRAATPQPLPMVGTEWSQVPALARPKSPSLAERRTQLVSQEHTPRR